MIAASTEKKIEAPLTDDEIIVELTNLIFAGTDTTSNTFSYLYWELAKNPQWQKRLRDELHTVAWGDEVVPIYKTVSNLPVLEAVIQETLRLWPASPASLPRIATAKGGTVDGLVIPSHVSICPLLPDAPSQRQAHTFTRLSFPPRATPRSETRRSSHCPTSSIPNAGCQRTRLAKIFAQTWT